MNKKYWKTGMIVLMVLSVLCFFTGCGEEKTESSGAENSEQTEQKEPEAFDETKFMKEIEPAMDFLITAEEEEFGAQYDSNAAFNAAFDTDGQQGEPALLYPANQTLPDGYFADNAAASYYLVNNYKNFSELENTVHKYIEGEALETIPEYKLDFAEVDGKLYLVRGGRGYGELIPVKDTLAYEEEKDGAQIVKMDYELFNEYDHTAHITFNKTDDGWKITDIHREWPE